MTDLLWPGDHRAGDLFTDAAFASAMVEVEAAWLAALVETGVAPRNASDDLSGLVGPGDTTRLAESAEAGGNPLIGLVSLLRERVRTRTPAAAVWLHRGLTSQDVLDTALMMCVRDAFDRIETDLRRQVSTVSRLAVEHRSTPMVGRTLTQHAVPITFGLKAASWLNDLVASGHAVARTRAALPVQVGGAAGSLAASTELAALRNVAEPAARSLELSAGLAARVGLEPSMPWHTSRRPVTAVGDALTVCTDGWGHLATDVATLSRPELGELAEGSGGGSSTMPQKHNPVLSVLMRRAALGAPGLAATLHTAAASTGDERSDGAWHVEWATLRTLARRTVVAGAQATELLGSLRVNTFAMTAQLDRAGDRIDAEQRSIASLVDAAPSPAYSGATAAIIDAACAGATTYLEETS